MKTVFLCMIAAVLVGCQETSHQNTPLQNSREEHPNIIKLKKHSDEFVPDIVQLGSDVYVAVGYDGSNASMIIGEDGVVIIDALRALGAAEKVAAKFKAISDKPVKALVYTHGHNDHTGGASAFIGETPDVKIIAGEGFKEELEGRSPVETVLIKRNARQFGRNLPVEDIINRGVAPGVTSKDRVGKGYIKPNMTLRDSMFITVAGIELQLYAIKGETNDALFVWCPDKKTLFTGDNYYKAFPNLYAIRGSRYRDVKAWGESVAKMSTFPAEYLVPGHTRPVSGKALIHSNLNNYSEAILSVYKQTVEAMNRGYTLEETVASVKLSDSLSNQPDLQEFYGSVAWGVRSIFFHYVGWFDGNPTRLFPLTPKKEAANIIALAGGEKKVFTHLQTSVNTGDYQWALQLSDYLLETDYDRAAVRALKVKALRGLASQQINAPARNYYLSYARELEKGGH